MTSVPTRQVSGLDGRVPGPAVPRVALRLVAGVVLLAGLVVGATGARLVLADRVLDQRAGVTEGVVTAVRDRLDGWVAAIGGAVVVVLTALFAPWRQRRSVSP